MKANTLYNYITLVEAGAKKFFASDFNLSGGDIQGLREAKLIKETGTTKEVFYKEINKSKKIKEWEVVGNPSVTIYEICRIMDEIKAFKNYRRIIEKVAQYDCNMMSIVARFAHTYDDSFTMKDILEGI
jgi:hypothetical protein